MRAFMRYASGREKNRLNQERYRNYVSDALCAVYGLDKRLSEMSRPMPDFDAQAIVDDVAARAGLEVV